MLTVKTNYRLSDYLPESTPSTRALRLLQDNFEDNMPNLVVYVEDIGIPEALALKQKLSKSPGVKSVFWLDDVIDVYKPLEMADPAVVASWYKDGTALFSLSLKEDNVAENINALKALIGDRGLLSGQALNHAVAQKSTSEEIPKIVMFIVPLTLFILFLSTGSWFEPVLFIITIGAAILINEGTNAFIGEVSFITKSAGAILQLAVSMDYAVFLLHRFSRFRQEGLALQKAMAEAMIVSFPSIAASAVTTIIG
ncbi:MAG TPA: MMPL family transporter, partial [Firmicutes bacterium]|nr:MMPL family transporter [Bacillota bacterium]